MNLFLPRRPLGRHEQRLAHGEHGDGKGRDFDPVQKLRHGKGQPCLAGQPVNAHQRQRKSDEQRGQPLHRAFAKGGRDGDKGQHHQRKIFTRAEDKRQLHDMGGKEGQCQRGQQTGDERSDGGGGKRRSAPPGAGHLVALQSGNDTCALPRRVQKDRGRGPAIHAAIIDAREHDKRACRIKPIGDRQQKRHRQRRADAGQDANRRAQRHADQCIEQDHRVKGGGKALQQKIECAHLSPRRSGFPETLLEGSASEGGRTRHRRSGQT